MIPEAREVRLDLFPAQSEEISDLLPTTPRTKPIRVIITDSHMIIYAETPNLQAGSHGPDPALILPVTEFYGSPRDGYLAISEGIRYYIKRMKHCGCGTSLRSPRPYPSTPYVITRTEIPVERDDSNDSEPPVDG